MPEILTSGYEGLDARAAVLVGDQLADVAAARAQRRQERLEQERIAAEAARKAEEERVAREAAEARAKAEADAQAAQVAVPQHRIVLDEPLDTPGKTQVQLHVTVEKQPSEDDLRTLLLWLFEGVKNRSGFEFRAHPNAIYIFVYTASRYDPNQTGGWIGRIAYNENSGDTKPQVDISDLRLDAQFQKETRKFGLSEDQRKKIFYEAVGLEDKASMEAGKKYPNDLKRQSEECNRLREMYRKQLLRKFKITKEVEFQIGLEGIAKNWPMPPVPPPPD